MSKQTIGRYLVKRLEGVGVRHVFGIPGDYVLGFYDRLVESNMEVVGTCTEIGAGYAADGYARVNGVGCVCVTYCVGGLNVLNAVAGAYAEKSPLIVISGAPGVGERGRSPLLHHQVRDFQTQKQIYEKVTVATAAIENAKDAPEQIDDAIRACLKHKRPVYIELPRDMVDEICEGPDKFEMGVEKSDAGALKEAVDETAEMLRKAKRPVILGGVEIHRFGLQEALLKLVEKTGYPFAATFLGKSILSEKHAQSLGVYEGAMGREATRRVVEGSDSLLILGAFLTDINLGGFTAKLDVRKSILAGSEKISIGHHHYEDVVLGDFIDKLTKANLGKRRKAVMPAKKEVKPYKARGGRAITIKRFWKRMDEFIGDDTVVIADVGDSLFGAADLTVYKRTEFISPAYYTSMGFAVPGALGAQLGNEKMRPVVFVGDGAFQMTGHELSTIVRCGLNPIVFVLNNKGYTTERFIHEGPYNEIQNWAYHLWPQLVGDGSGMEVRTEGELEEALERAKATARCFTIVNVHLDKMDGSAALERLGKRLGQRV